MAEGEGEGERERDGGGGLYCTLVGFGAGLAMDYGGIPSPKALLSERITLRAKISVQNQPEGPVPPCKP